MNNQSPVKPFTIALTISPKDRVAEYYMKKYKNPLRSVYDDDKYTIIRSLNRCSKDYVIYPELDKTGRLHYHGVVNVTNYKNWLSYSTGHLKTIGYISIKDNPNEGWYKYCNKEWSMTKQILNIDEPIKHEKLKRGVKPEHKMKGDYESHLTKVQRSILDLLEMEANNLLSDEE